MFPVVIVFLIGFSLASVDEYRLLQYLKEVSSSSFGGRQPFQSYDYFERPVANSSEPLDVKVRFLLNQILDVVGTGEWRKGLFRLGREEPSHADPGLHRLRRFIFEFLLKCPIQHWTDYKMTWDPKKFGNITDVRFHGGQDAPFKLWRPDILLFNRWCLPLLLEPPSPSSVSEAFDSTYASRFLANYDGHVQQNPPGIFRFICRVRTILYPLKIRRLT